jgi:hypothetical protein
MSLCQLVCLAIHTCQEASDKRYSMLLQMVPSSYTPDQQNFKKMHEAGSKLVGQGVLVSCPPWFCYFACGSSALHHSASLTIGYVRKCHRSLHSDALG